MVAELTFSKRSAATLLLAVLSLFCSSANAQREGDIDRNILSMGEPSLTVGVGSRCGITEEDAQNAFLLQLARNGFGIADDSQTTYLWLGIECLELFPGGPIFFDAETSISVEAVTLFDLGARVLSKDKSGGPKLTVAEIWSDSRRGTATLEMRRPQLESAIKALADSVGARRLQAASRSKK